jgi:hypothetical protein
VDAAVGDRIRAFVDGDLLFDVTDGSHAAGGCGSATRGSAAACR